MLFFMLSLSSSQEVCVAAIRDLPHVDAALGANSLRELRQSNALAALCVVGGFTETLRIGSRVEVSGEFSGFGTLVREADAADGTVSVVLEDDASCSIQHLPLSQLTPVPECDASPDLLPLSPQVLSDFLSMLQNSSSSGDSSFCSFLRADLRARSVQGFQTVTELALFQPPFLQLCLPCFVLNVRQSSFFTRLRPLPVSTRCSPLPR